MGTVEMRKPLPDMVWPKPPEIPRIHLVNTVSRPEDLNIKASGFNKFFGYLSGKTERTMVAPYGVETDSSGRLYVVDTALKTVHVFDHNANRYNTFSTKKTTLTSPIDIAIDNKMGTIYITDSKEGVVKIYRNAGKEFAGEIGEGILERPTGIAINKETSELLVVDTMGANIFRFTLDDLQFKGILGGDGEEQGKFHYPTHICVAGDGTILISDSLNFRIQVLSQEGRFLRSFGAAGENPGYFTRPKGVASDSDGNIYVVDALFDNVQIFNREGSLLLAFGEHGIGYGEFWLPTGIYIDESDRIYVSDSYNKRVQIFQYLKDELAPGSE